MSTDIEKEIQAKGLTAPRVTPQRINDVIASEHYFTAADGASRKPSDTVWDVGAYGAIPKQLSLLTFCVLVLKNGFTVTGESACASPENFDAEIGRKTARENAVSKIWMLEGYLLKQQLSEEKHCTDERPCVNCFADQGDCLDAPFGGPELLDQARALCQAIERLPAGTHQTKLITKVADATFALQNLQSTGDYFWPRPVQPTMAAQDVLAERRRQVEGERWTPEHDDEHSDGEIAKLAAIFAMPPECRDWDHRGGALGEALCPEGWVPKFGDRRRELVKAGALILAEIERLDRKSDS